MNDPKTADQINSQVLGHAKCHPIPPLQEAWPRTYELFMKRNIALRLLVEKWRERSQAVDQVDGATRLRQCAKELEEAISGL